MELLDVLLETDGRYWDLFRVEFRDRPPEQWEEACADVPTYSLKLAVESRNRFAALNSRLLERHGLGIEDVDHFVMQNISIGALRFYEQGLGVRFASACAQNLRSYGHLGPADVLLNLRTGLATDEFAPGETVLVMNNSPAAAWSSALVRL
jgi:3-oxoacyl-[acyl-carrier-protein] synthase-3